MPEKDPLLERQQLHADSLEGDDNADGGLYTMGQTNVQHGILRGKRILVTRTREQAGVLSGRLLALGAMPVEFPTIRIVPPPRPYGTRESTHPTVPARSDKSQCRCRDCRTPGRF